MKDELFLQLMNTNFYITVPFRENSDWKQQVTCWLEYVATEWSRFRDNNELARLNQLPVGATIQLSAPLYDCLMKAQYYYQITDGLFSPYLKRQLEQHGYKETWQQTKTTYQKTTTIYTPIQHPQPIEFLQHMYVKKHVDVEIDLGGIAKGYAVEKTAQLLKKLQFTEYGLVDGGGDMTMWSAGSKEWTISIADPYEEQQDVTYIKLYNGSIATSNRLYRCWTQNTTRKHHILNGQTGEVAHTPVVQASVVTSSLCDAEVGTKMCFLLDENAQRDWLHHYVGQSARFIIKEHEQGAWFMTKGENVDVR